jgi:glycosyltransferase involved in cell wall biosynthesis
MRKIIIITPVLPYPPDDGGRLRIYQTINSLATICRIDLVSFYIPYEDIESARKFYASLCRNIFFLPQRESKPTFSSLFTVYRISQKNKKEINEIIERDNYDMIILEKVIMLSYIRNRIFKNEIVIADTWGIDSNITFQFFIYEKKIFRKFFYFLKHIRHLFAEIYLLSKCNYLIAITDKIYYFYKKIFRKKRVYLIPSAVDLEYYKPMNAEIEKGKIVFIGVMNYYPNVDAVLFFVREVLPKLRTKVDVKFFIVGKNPSPELFSLHNGSDIIVTGTVDDVRKYISDSELIVVPLRMGTGLRNKVIQAMACGKCVIATKESCEGLNVKDGENILIADTPEEFVEKILIVFDNKNVRLKIEKNARKYVEDNFSYDIIKKKWIEFYEEILGNNNNRRQA